MNVEMIRQQIRNAPSYPKLLKAVRSFYVGLYGKGNDAEERLKKYEGEPELLLTAYAGVMNAKSQRAKTLQSIASQIFQETRLPRKPQGKFRGMDGLDWEKCGSGFSLHKTSMQHICCKLNNDTVACVLPLYEEQ